MAGLFERMGLIRTEYEGMPEIPMQPVSEPMYAPETPVIDATQVSYDDVIASIYQQGDIDDEKVIYHEENETHYRWPCGDLRHRAGAPRWYRRLRLQLLQEQHRRRQTHQFGHPVWQHVPEAHDKALRRQDGHL